MLARLASLRLWLLAAMIVSAAIGLGGASLLYRNLQLSQEHAADAAQTLQEARGIAAQVQAGADVARVAALQALLVSDRLTIERGGRTIFQGPARLGHQLELRVSAPFDGGVVRIADYAALSATNTLDLTLITAGVLALVIAAAILTATLVTRAVRVPVQRAMPSESHTES